MKKLYTLFLSIITIALVNAQNPIPNAGFETYWNFGTAPNGWTDSRDINQVAPGCSTGASNDLHSAQGIKTSTTYPAFITSVTATGNGISISSAYTYFHLTCAFTSVSADLLTITVSVRNAAKAQIGSTLQQITTSTGCTAYHLPIYYPGSTAAADVVISVLMNSNIGGNPHVNSSFYLDNLLLSNSPTGIQDIEKESSSLRIFPNPATNYIQIEAEGKMADVRIADIAGRIVKEINNVDFSSGSFNLQVNDLPAGSYLVALKNDKMIRTKKLVIE